MRDKKGAAAFFDFRHDLTACLRTPFACKARKRWAVSSRNQQNLNIAHCKSRRLCRPYAIPCEGYSAMFFSVLQVTFSRVTFSGYISDEIGNSCNRFVCLDGFAPFFENVFHSFSWWDIGMRDKTGLWWHFWGSWHYLNTPAYTTSTQFLLCHTSIKNTDDKGTLPLFLIHIKIKHTASHIAIMPISA